MQALQALEALDAEHGKDWQFIAITPIKTPLRQGDHQKIDAISQRMLSWADSNPRVTVVDANPRLASADGGPNPAFFRPDGSSLNEAGYLRLSLPLEDLIDS